MPVASLADVIRSKEAAGRQKDFTALPALLERLLTLQSMSPQDQTAAMARRAEERFAVYSPAPESKTRGSPTQMGPHPRSGRHQ